MVSQTDMKTGRIQQKQRTRQALLEAAWRLLRQGKQPTVADVAEEAMISRATAYRYFPDRERLLVEAVLEQRIEVPEDLFGSQVDDSSADRVGLVQELLFDHVIGNETLHRLSLRASLDEWQASKDKSRLILRGDRRTSLLEQALAADRDKIGDDEYERLLHALSAMVGLESYLVLRDVGQLSPERAREIMNWAVHKLVEAVIA